MILIVETLAEKKYPAIPTQLATFSRPLACKCSQNIVWDIYTEGLPEVYVIQYSDLCR